MDFFCSKYQNFQTISPKFSEPVGGGGGLPLAVNHGYFCIVLKSRVMWKFVTQWLTSGARLIQFNSIQLYLIHRSEFSTDFSCSPPHPSPEARNFSDVPVPFRYVCRGNATGVARSGSCKLTWKQGSDQHDCCVPLHSLLLLSWGGEQDSVTCAIGHH